MIPFRRGAPWLLSIIFFVSYSALSVLRHMRMESSAYDLGIFAQIIRSYAELNAPIATIKGVGFNALGDHFDPILIALAPFYRLFPNPVTLLIAQAMLFALSVAPITSLAIDRCGRFPGSCIGVAYGLSFGIQQAVNFDFHEIAFAVPLVALSVTALARKHWKLAATAALPLLLVKEDQALIVMAIGIYLVCQGQRRIGAAVTIGALMAGITEVFLIIPAFNPRHVYPYLAAAGSTDHSGITRLFLPSEKLGLLVSLALPTLFLALLSPIFLLVLPTLLLRLWATNPGYWATGFHYNSVLMPILFVACIDSMRRIHDRIAHRERADPPGLPWFVRITNGRIGWMFRDSSVPQQVAVSRALVRVAGAGVLMVALAITFTSQPLRRLAHPSYWRIPADVRVAKSVLDVIPVGVDVAAANHLAPQLVSNHHVFMFPDFPSIDVQPLWVAVEEDPDPWPISAQDQLQKIDQLPGMGYVEIAHGGGVRVYRKSDDPNQLSAGRMPSR